MNVAKGLLGMASLSELIVAIQKLRAERPAEFVQFESRYPGWESWPRGPYGPQREALELMLSKYGVLAKEKVGGNTRQKRFSIISCNIKIPLGSHLTLTGISFFKVFGGTYYLFRRPGRLFGAPRTQNEFLFVSRVDINDQRPLNYVETRKGDGKAIAFKQAGVAYLAEGSLIFMSSDELGHPWITSYARVSPQNIPDFTPILDGHLLASTFEPARNGNFVVRVMLVKAPDGSEATTGAYRIDEEALAEFQKLKPDSWNIDLWNRAFLERFNTNAPVRFDGDYFQEFETHKKFEI
jgi:hypothetical protein